MQANPHALAQWAVPGLRAFIDAQSQPRTIAQVVADSEKHGAVLMLNELPARASADQVASFRNDLELYLAELIRLQCRLDALDRQEFWAQVKATPNKFVSPERLPDGILFGNPHDMAEADFRVVYSHIWLSHVDPNAVRPELRFEYEPHLLNEYMVVGSAIRRLAVWRRLEQFIGDWSVAADSDVARGGLDQTAGGFTVAVSVATSPAVGAASAQAADRAESPTLDLDSIAAADGHHPAQFLELSASTRCGVDE